MIINNELSISGYFVDKKKNWDEDKIFFNQQLYTKIFVGIVVHLI
jgi:hypothetical protein